MGTIVSLPVSGVLSSSVGWESVFYLFGGISAFWCLAWFLLIADDPASHPRISLEEKQFIQANTMVTARSQSKAKLKIAPYGRIMNSIPFIALIMVHFGHDWGFYTLLNEIPTYLNNIQHFPLSQVSFFVPIFVGFKGSVGLG